MHKKGTPRLSDNPKYPLKRIWLKPQGPLPTWISNYCASMERIFFTEKETYRQLCKFCKPDWVRREASDWGPSKQCSSLRGRPRFCSTREKRKVRIRRSECVRKTDRLSCFGIGLWFDCILGTSDLKQICNELLYKSVHFLLSAKGRFCMFVSATRDKTKKYLTDCWWN